MPLEYVTTEAVRPPTTTRKETDRAAKKRRVALARQPLCIRSLPSGITRQFAIDYLDPLSRRSLCWTDKTLYDCLHKVVYAESVIRHIPLTRTVSAVQQVLREIRRAGYEQQAELWIRLARRIAALPGNFRRPAMELMLATLGSLDQKVRLVSALAPAHTRDSTGSRTAACDLATAAPGSPVWTLAEVLQLRQEMHIYRLATEALLRHCSYRDIQAYGHALGEDKIATIDGKVARLLSSISALRSRSASPQALQSKMQAWKALYREFASVPDDQRPALLCAYAAAAPSTNAAEAAQQWDALLQMASTASGKDQAALYTGMIALLADLPDATIGNHFESLWQRCAALQWRGHDELLQRMANACTIDDRLRPYVQRIIATAIDVLPAASRLAPVRILIQRFPQDLLDNRLPSTLSLPKEKLSAEERSILIGECAMSPNYRGPLQPLMQQALELPATARGAALAGIVRNHSIVKTTGGAPWIDTHIVPQLKAIPSRQAVHLLRNLAALALDAHNDACIGTPTESLLSQSAWKSVRQHIAHLDPVLRADLLIRLCSGGIRVEHPVWHWALAQCATLPRYLQAPILHALASAKQPGSTSDTRPLRKLLPRIANLPKLYRAFPLQAAISMRKQFDFTDSMRTLIPVLRLQWSLPVEDRI